MGTYPSGALLNQDACQLAATTSDRIAACNCVKAAASGFPVVDFSHAAALPAACGLAINFAVTPNMDCNQ
uniref:Non-specific lipid-transfer protein n=1 Tax=Aegilops tauschii TaxID=37682 RepID=N1QXE1_AEGTA